LRFAITAKSQQSADIAARWLDPKTDEGQDTREIDFLTMQAFIASLMAAVLFIHTIFGCCWHHAHACEHSPPIAISQPAQCCHHHHNGSDSKQQHTPCRCNVDCEGACTYVVPQKVKVEAPQHIAIDMAAVLPSLAGESVEVTAAWKALSSPNHLAPPLRAHLLHQVLLI
jgi:hypothetical protein